MAVQNRGNGSWRVVISGGYGPDGKQIRITRTIHVNPNSTLKSQKAQAKKEEALLKADYERQQITDAKKLTFKAVYEDYLKDRLARRKLAQRTIDSYKDLFERELLPSFGKTAIREINARDINKFLQKLADRDLSGTYCLKYYQQLHELFVYAQRSGIIVINPCDLVEPPKRDTQEAQYYDKDEAINIASCIEKCSELKWKAFFSLSFYCGTRPGELVGLNWDDYDGTNIFVQAGSYRGKGAKTTRTDRPKTRRSIRKIQLPAEAIAALSAWKTAQAKYRLKFGKRWPDPQAIFTNDMGYRISIYAPSRKWKAFAEQNKFRYLPLYDLRHTHCSILIASRELSIEEVAARMGHEQTSTTLNIYTHAFADSNERATAAFTKMLKHAEGE